MLVASHAVMEFSENPLLEWRSKAETIFSDEF
jgi:hypothetical protein